jgi:TAK1-binding protein 1
VRSEGERGSVLAEAEERVVQGAVGVLAVIIKNRLFIASIGDCGALLCRDHEVIPLFCNHTTDNEDEILRLCHLGVDVELGQVYPELGDGRLTRCFGNYLVKGGYKENSLVSRATQEPIIPDPEIFGAITLDNDVCMLLLYTNSLVKAFSEATALLNPEHELVQHTRHYMCKEASLSGVAQAVVDQVVRLHHDRLEVTGGQAVNLEDMTLLVRDLREFRTKDSRMAASTLTGSSARPTMQSSTTTDSSEVDNTGKELPVDENGRISPYVDFAPFWRLWTQRKVSQNSLSSLEKS